MLARVQSPDGSLEPPRTVVEVQDEPREGDYIVLDDGRRVQVLGYARQPDGRLSYLIVAEPRK